MICSICGYKMFRLKFHKGFYCPICGNVTPIKEKNGTDVGGR